MSEVLKKSIFCMNFECPNKECPHHDSKSRTVRGARHTYLEGKTEFCIKLKSNRTNKIIISEIPVPTEDEEQEALFQWAEVSLCKYPELDTLFHITNEGKRSKYQGAKLKREGLREGVSDICLPVKKGEYGSLFIELKRRKYSTVSKAQEDWIALMWERGNAAYVCYGWEEARDRIEEYLNL